MPRPRGPLPGARSPAVLTSPAGLTSVSFEGAQRSPTDDGTRESLSSDSSSLDSLNSGSFGVDTLAGEARGGG